MEAVKISAAAVVGVLLITAIKPFRKDFAVALSILTGIVIFGYIFVYLKSAVGTIGDITARFGINGAAVEVIFKIICVAYICEFASGICRDAGESAVASKVETGGKLIIVYLSMPIITSLIDLLAKFL